MGSRVIPFEPEHLLALDLQDAQRGAVSPDLMGQAELCKASGPCWTVVDGERVTACAGFLIWWPGRATGWALIGKDVAGRGLLALTRVVRLALEESGLNRVDSHVEDGFEQGHRWAAILGATYEGRMRKYCPNGKDAHLYAWTRE
jgi:RimJ/RimL family protein N-acetyltransferase